ncbi:MAG: hypothetical protein ACT4NV_19220 [Rhodoferax sp.]
MLLLISIAKLVLEIALLSLLGQWLVGLLAGAKREQNMVYALFQVLTRPFVRGVRWITPKVVIDRHIPLATFVLLLMAWVAVTAAKISTCLHTGVQACQ